jgi:hypothetical protein
MLNTRHCNHYKVLVKVDNDEDSGLHVLIGLQSGSCSEMHASR